MPPAILSSPFLDLSVLNKILAGDLSADERVQWLQAKLTILTNPSAQLHTNIANDGAGVEEITRVLGEVTVRIELARLYMGQVRLVPAEAELGVAEGRCKETIKRYRRQFSDARGAFASESSYGPVSPVDSTASHNASSGGPLASAEPAVREGTARGQITDPPERARAGGGQQGDVQECGDTSGGRERGAREDAEGEQVRRLLDELLGLRISALEMLGDVEEGLGRDGRAKKRRELVVQLRNGQ